MSDILLPTDEECAAITRGFEENAKRKTKELLLEEYHTRVKATQDFVAFIGRMFADIFPTDQAGFVMGEHLLKVATILNTFRDAVEQGKDPRLMIFLPPRTGKTTFIASFFAWMIGHHSNWEYILCSFSEDRAADLGNMLHRYFQAPLFKEMFPDFALSSKSSSAVRAEFKKGGAMTCGSPGSGLNGRGGKVLWLDDAHKDEAAADSDAERNHVNQWVMSTFMRRQVPTGAGILITQTRWRCLHPESNVYGIRKGTNIMSTIPIKDISVGDAVLSSDNFAEVRKVVKSTKKTRMFSIRAYGDITPLRCTEDHRVWVRRAGIVGWKEARDIHLGDEVFYPRLTVDAAVPGWPTPAERPALRSRAGASKSKYFAHTGAIEKVLQKGGGYADVAKLFGKTDRATGFSICRTVGLRVDRTDTLMADPTADLDFWWVVGRWAADGNLTWGRSKDRKHRVVWSIGYKKENDAVKIATTLKRYGVVCQVNKKKNRGREDVANPFHTDREWSVYEVRCSCPQLAEFLARHVGELAHRKRFSKEIMELPKHFASAVLDGWVSGDGCVDGSRVGRYRIVSVSRDLLETGKVLSLRCDRWMPIVFHKEAAINRCGFLGANGRNQVTKHGVWCSVRETSFEDYDGEVWDITTSTGDFVANGMLVHNCDDAPGMLLKIANENPAADQWMVYSFPAIENEWTDNEKSFFPERFPVEKLQRWRAGMMVNQPRSWSALYQQNPQPAQGIHIKASWFDRCLAAESDFPDKRTVTNALTIDFAVSDGAGNHTALHPISFDCNDVCWVRPDSFYKQADPKETLEQIEKLLKRYDPSYFFVEKGPIWKSLGSTVRNVVFRNARCYPKIVEISRGKKNKREVASPYINALEAGLVRYCNNDFTKGVIIPQHLAFGASSSDDIVDALALPFVERGNIMLPSKDVELPPVAEETWQSQTNDFIRKNAFEKEGEEDEDPYPLFAGDRRR